MSNVGDKITAKSGSWSFGGKTPKNFKEHISRSVPLYNEGQISLNEATKLRNKWAKLTEREKKEILETQG